MRALQSCRRDYFFPRTEWLATTIGAAPRNDGFRAAMRDSELLLLAERCVKN
jgi:hypothetical protein